MEFVTHTFPPYFDENSAVLILGTMPSPKSREQGFYYGHPQNRFWRVLAGLFDESPPVTVAEKKDLLTRHHIALWDVLASCSIEGASDSSIKDPIANDIGIIKSAAPIRAVFTTGGTAHRLYRKFCGNDDIPLPSTSPANCRLKYENLLESYRLILSYL